MLSEGQYQVRDLVLGEGTPYTILNASNLWKRSVRADMAGDRPWSHGTWSGAEWADEAVIPLSIMVAGDGFEGWSEAHRALARAFRPVGVDGDVEFRWRIGGKEQLMFCRPRLLDPDSENIGVGLARTQCALVCPDPFIYSANATVVGPIVPPSYVGGWSLPFILPFEIPSTLTGGEAALFNEGTEESGLLLRIDGPCSVPSVTVINSEVRMVTVDLTIGSGEWIDIDTQARTVLLNGVSNRRGDAYGTWPLAPVGDSTIRYRSQDAAGSLTVTFRSKWW